MQPPTFEEIEAVAANLKRLRKMEDRSDIARSLDIELLALRILTLTMHSMSEQEIDEMSLTKEEKRE